MKPWLEGDLSEVDARAELSALRDVVQSAAHRSIDLRPFWIGLAEHDPVACAELAAGPRAVGHPDAVKASLAASYALERVLAPSGLYSRLIALAPETVKDVIRIAAQRHPTEAWIWRLGRGEEATAGLTALQLHASSEFFDQSCRSAASAELNAARPNCADHVLGSLL